MRSQKTATITREVVITFFVTSLIIVGIAYALHGAQQQVGIGETPTMNQQVHPQGFDEPSVSQPVITAGAQSAQHVSWQLPQGLAERFSLDLSIAEPYVISLEEPQVVQDYLQREYIFPLLITEGEQTLATAKVHFRYMDNGDILYFFSGSQGPNGADGKAVRLRWNVTEKTIDPSREISYISYGDKIDNATSQWVHHQLPVYAEALTDQGMTIKLPMASVYTDTLRLGIVDVFSTLDHHVFVEHIDLSPANEVTVFHDRNVWSAELPLYAAEDQPLLTEHWGVLSGELLFNQAAGSTDYEDIRVADLDRFRKMRVDGIYYEVPESYVPYEPRAFWRVPAEHIGQRFIRSIKEQQAAEEQRTPSSYLATMAIASLNHSLKQQTDQGYWITSPQSNWLYGDYGVAAGFYDTRFSTDAALFLLDMSQYYDLPDVFDAVTRYADFLLWYADHYSFTTLSGGLLVQDYFHPTIPHNPTHVSLNHLVTEMNFLLMYDKELRHRQGEGSGSDDIGKAYVELAEKIRMAVDDTGLVWVKDNSDLWYAYMPDGTYGLQDYPHLTRNDLRLSVSLMNEYWGEAAGDMFRKLIYYKEVYLQENGFPLW